MIKKSSNANPWFPGPVLIHRKERKEDFSFYWQSVTRFNEKLKNIAIIGTDECPALYEGILSQTENTAHLLGLEHVKKNVEENLQKCNIPRRMQHGIVSVIFGDDGLINCSSCEAFDAMLSSLVEKWDTIEKDHTKNQPPHMFSKYFKEHKAEKMKHKMIKWARDQISYKGDYFQNCIEWAHYMSKSEIDVGQKGAHKTVSLVEAIKKIKQRYLRMYTEGVKAIYGEGKYKLSEEYFHFLVPYQVWMGESEQERIAVTKKFFDELPKKQESSISPINHSKDCNQQSPTEADHHSQVHAIVPETQENSVADSPFAIGNTTLSKSVVEAKKNLPINHKAFPIPDNIIPTHSLTAIFDKAHALVNEKGAVTKAASMEPNMRTVKSSYDVTPHIVQPKGKNKNYLHCDCRIFNWYKICQHALAASIDIGNCFEYLTEARKKIMLGKVSLTDAINTTRKISEKGMKNNEVQKAAKKERKKKTTVSIKEGSTTCAVSISPQQVDFEASRQRSMINSQQYFPQYQPSISWSNGPLPTSQHQIMQNPLSTTCAVSISPQQVGFEASRQRSMINSQQYFPQYQPSISWSNAPLPTSQHQVMQNSAQSSLMPSQQSLSNAFLRPTPNLTANTQQWHSGMSPHKYSVVEKPSDVSKCYGCGAIFADKYNHYPNNLIVKHLDRRIRGKNQEGQLLYNVDFTPSNYHSNREHITRKNPVFDGTVYMSKGLADKFGSDKLALFVATTGLNIVLQ